jgi:hypothetical protein
VKLKLEKVVGLDQPLALAQRAGDGRLYVAEKRGRVQSVCGRSAEPILDISGQVSLGASRGFSALPSRPRAICST